MAEYLEIINQIDEEGNESIQDIKLDLTADEQNEQIRLIKEELGKIISERKHKEQIWDEADRQDSGNTEDETDDIPWEGHSQAHINLIRSTKKTLLVKAKKMMFTNPMMLCKNPINTKYSEDIRSQKESYINFKVTDRTETNLADSESAVLNDAALYGTGWLKFIWNEKMRVVKDTEYYTPMDIDKFKENFGDTKDYGKFAKKLNNGAIVLNVKKRIKVGNGLEAQYVPLRNMFYHDKPKDLNKHRLIAELHEMSWDELNCYFTNEIFEKSVKDEIIKDGEHEKKPYKVWECIWKYDYDDDGETERVVIIYLELNGGEYWLTGTEYPYNHNEPYYVPFRIEEEGDCVDGIGCFGMLRHVNKIIDNLWNQTIDTGTMMNAPAFEVQSNTGFDPTVKRWGPLVIWWVRQSGTIKPLNNVNAGARLPVDFIDRLLRYQEFETGVSIGMSGQESPQDPRAPAAKTMMLLQEANLKIDDYINTLQKSNIRIFYMADSMLQQYYYEDENFTGYLKDKEIKRVDPNVLFSKFSFVPQYSQMTLNKALEQQYNKEMFQWLMGVPGFAQNPNIVRKGAEIVVRSMNDSWNNAIDEILPSVQEIQVVQQQQQMMLAAQTQSKQGGI